MKRSFVLLFATALWITGCSADGLTGLEGEAPSAGALAPSTARTLVGMWEARDAFGTVVLTITEEVNVPTIGTSDGPRLSTLGGVASLATDGAPPISPTLEGSTRDHAVRLLLLKADGTVLAKVEGEVNADFSALKLQLQEAGKPARLLRFSR